MINAIKLQDQLTSNPDKILEVLSALGYEDIKDKGKYFAFKNIDGDNPTAVTVLKDTLAYRNYTRDKSGNLFTLVMDMKHYNFPQALEWIANKVGIKQSEVDVNVKYPFDGFYKTVIRNFIEPELNVNTYDEKILPPADCYSKMFCDEHIPIAIQKEFGVRFSHEDNSILIPVYNMGHELVGVKGRNNSNDDPDHRWYAWLPYSKSLVVYGLDLNYEDIIKSNALVIYESEKSVQKAAAMGVRCTCAIAGHCISEVQAKIIKSLMVKNIIVAFDEGINEEEIIFEAKKLKVNNAVYQNNVYYIYDGKHTYLPNGSKDAPIDRGRKIMNNLIKECRKKV